MKHALTLVTIAAVLGGCASTGTPPAAPAPAVAPAWQAPLPAGGGALAGWWQRFDDPALVPLVEAAQAASPTLSQAAARIAQARATRTAAGAGLLPQLGAAGSVARAADPTQPIATSASGALQASWELDFFGGVRAGRDAAQARLASAEASAQAARIGVAAETAASLVELRACEAQAAQTRIDAESRAETARLTDLAAQAGFRAPADAALARASAAQGRAQLAEQQARCELLVKSLVEVTALDEPALRQRLAARSGQLPQGAPVALATLPAALLQQRPDLISAAANVSAAAADRAQREAARWPQVTLSGSMGALRVSSAAATVSGSTWSLGPLALNLPLFDGGRRAADVDAARASYDDAVLQLQAAVRGAVREVEQALVRLDAAGRRRDDAQAAVQGFEQSLAAVEARWKGGLASLFELEDARRNAVAARSSLIDLERERLAASIALYRALGGGWTAN